MEIGVKTTQPAVPPLEITITLTQEELNKIGKARFHIYDQIASRNKSCWPEVAPLYKMLDDIRVAAAHTGYKGH